MRHGTGGGPAMPARADAAGVLLQQIDESLARDLRPRVLAARIKGVPS